MNKLKKEIIAAAIGGIDESQPDTIKQKYRFDPKFIGFSGHFPDNPILPAMVQIMMALVAVEKQKECHLEAVSVEKAKFHLPVQPDQEIEVACRLRPVGGLSGCDARLSIAIGLAASFRISFKEKEGAG